MNTTEPAHTRLPAIGFRIIKSAVGVFLCLITYLIRRETGIPFYSALATLWCIQPLGKSTRKNALQRMTGTFIGAAYGLIFILLNFYLIHPVYDIWHYFLLSLFIIPVIYTTVLLNRQNTSYFSCVVYLSIVVNHLGDANPYLFVWNRVLDTLIGIGIGYLISIARLPRKRRKDILFVSGLDGTLLNLEHTLTPYCKIELNRMLGEGLNFTIATRRTPASMIDMLKGVDLKLPVIAMDGAVLYDTHTHCYKKVYLIGRQSAQQIYRFLREEGFHVFTNIIKEDLLIILYGDFTNPAEQQLYDSLHTSLYRNYVKGTLSDTLDVVYFVVLDTRERTELLYDKLQELGWTDRFKVLYYAAEDYPGYYYIKIYNKQASRKHMIDYLMKEINVNEAFRFGTIPDQCDYVIHDGSGNGVVKLLRRYFSPVIWSKKTLP